MHPPPKSGGRNPTGVAEPRALPRCCCGTFFLHPLGMLLWSPAGAGRFPESSECASGHCPLLGGVWRLCPECLLSWRLQRERHSSRRSPLRGGLAGHGVGGTTSSTAYDSGLARDSPWLAAWQRGKLFPLMTLNSREESRGTLPFLLNGASSPIGSLLGQGHLAVVSQAWNLTLVVVNSV